MKDSPGTILATWFGVVFFVFALAWLLQSCLN